MTLLCLLVLAKLLRQLIELLQFPSIDGLVVRLLRPGLVVAMRLLQGFHLGDILLLSICCTCVLLLLPSIVLRLALRSS